MSKDKNEQTFFGGQKLEKQIKKFNEIIKTKQDKLHKEEPFTTLFAKLYDSKTTPEESKQLLAKIEQLENKLIPEIQRKKDLVKPPPGYGSFNL